VQQITAEVFLNNRKWNYARPLNFQPLTIVDLLLFGKDYHISTAGCATSAE